MATYNVSLYDDPNSDWDEQQSSCPELVECYSWCNADFSWEDANYTWNDVCIAQEVAVRAGGSSWTAAVKGLEPEKRKRLIELTLYRKFGNIDIEVFNDTEEVQDIHVSVEDIKVTVEQIIDVTLIGNVHSISRR